MKAQTRLAPSISEVMDFVADENSIYYFESETTSRFALRKISINGGDPTTLDRGEDSWNKYLTVDKSQVYFTTIAKVYVVPK
jgi:hypothetical protein